MQIQTIPPSAVRLWSSASPPPGALLRPTSPSLTARPISPSRAVRPISPSHAARPISPIRTTIAVQQFGPKAVGGVPTKIVAPMPSWASPATPPFPPDGATQHLSETAPDSLETTILPIGKDVAIQKSPEDEQGEHPETQEASTLTPQSDSCLLYSMYTFFFGLVALFVFAVAEKSVQQRSRILSTWLWAHMSMSTLLHMQVIKVAVLT